MSNFVYLQNVRHLDSPSQLWKITFPCTYRRGADEKSLHLVSVPVLDRGWWSTSRFGRFASGKKPR